MLFGRLFGCSDIYANYALCVRARAHVYRDSRNTFKNEKVQQIRFECVARDGCYLLMLILRHYFLEVDE